MSGKPIANIYDKPGKTGARGSRYECTATRLGAATGMKALGAQYMVVPAGKAAFPRHSHYNNEEMYVILAGEGTYFRGKENWSVKTGDVISAPAGDEKTAHQLVNTSKAELKYLVISTRNDPDICIYPDSKKYLVAADIPDGSGMTGASFMRIGRLSDLNRDYWDGEDIGDKK